MVDISWLTVGTTATVALLGGAAIAGPALIAGRADLETARGSTPFFIKREANKVFARTKGERPLDMIAYFEEGASGKTFHGYAHGGNPNAREYWQVINRHRRNMWATEYASAPLKPLVAAANLFSDVALVGFEDFYELKTTKLEKFGYEKKGDGTGPRFVIVPPNPETNISNHVRVTPFQWPIFIAGANTSDRLPWNILVVLQLQCVNPFVAFYTPEMWSQIVNTTVYSAVVEALQQMEGEDVLRLERNDHGELMHRLADAILATNETLRRRTGHEIVVDAEAVEGAHYNYNGVNFVSYEPRLETQEDQLAWLQVWRASQAATEIRLLAEQTSTAIELEAEAAAKFGPIGDTLIRFRKLVEAVERGQVDPTFVVDATRGDMSRFEALVAGGGTSL